MRWIAESEGPIGLLAAGRGALHVRRSLLLEYPRTAVSINRSLLALFFRFVGTAESFPPLPDGATPVAMSI
jgi:hypothetical protein